MKSMSRTALSAVGAAIVPGAIIPRAVTGVRVRADATDPKALIEQINKAFAEFKDKNDERLKQLEAKGEDAVTKDQVEKINGEMSSLQKSIDKALAELAASKVGAGAGKSLSPEASAHSKAFNGWFRNGSEPGNMRELEINAKLTTQSDPDGGYLVPEEMESTIDRVLMTVSAIRNLARVINVSTDEYKKLVNMGGAGSGWVGEEEARTETGTPTLREIIINVAEIYAEPGATQRSLDDSRIDVAQWLADEVAIAFAEKEGAGFVNGDGVRKPRGFLQYPTVANASYSWGNLGFTVSGNASSFVAPTTSVSPADALIQLYYALKAGYRNGASWVMSDATIGTVRQFKDGFGNYIFAPPTGPDMPATILGKPLVTDDNMPAVGANAFPIAFGNFQRAYLVVDRFGIRVLRDPFTSKGNVLFYTTKRVGGGVVNFEALKLLKISA